MRVFCAYNQEYDRFLISVVEYVIRKYGDNLDLRNVEEIELIKTVEDSTTDGRFLGARIVVTERLYKMLPILDIMQLEDNEVFEEIAGVLYHEMGHATDMVRMPKMYSCVLYEDLTLENMATYLFLEYIAERRTQYLGINEYDTFCASIKAGEWNKYDVWSSKDAFYYLSKLFVYFIIKTNVKGNRREYLNDDKSQLLLEYVNALDHALQTVYSLLPFDEVEKCKPIADVMKKYGPIFDRTYTK